METREARQIKLMMLIAFAVSTVLILIAHYSAERETVSFLEYIGTLGFIVLALLYWRRWEPAALIAVVLVAILVGVGQPEPYITQHASLTIFLPAILALVLSTPRGVIIASATALLILLFRAGWQGIYSEPLFLSIYGTLIGGLLISRQVLEIKNRQLEALNRTLEQRILERTHDLEQALDELRLSEGRLRSVVTNAPLIMFGINQQGLVTVAEGRGLAALGIVPARIIGRSAFNVYRNQPLFLANLRRALAGEAFSTNDNVNGYTFETWYTPIREANGMISGLTGVAIDVTERQRAEAEIQRHSEELAQANRELAQAARLKNEFLANMSHELRTPLASILGRSELLQDEHSGTLTDFQRRSVRGIEESGRHLLELINDILDLSKIEAGKLLIEIQPVAIAGLIQSSIRMITDSAQRKHLHVQIALDQSVEIVDADPRRLKQILVNLLSNAVKFTPDGGSVGIEVQANPRNETVDLIVWDTGIGIASVDQQRLFQPFVQIDSGLSRQYDGSGLGLALVDRLTKQHGGSIALSSEPGQGSRFTIRLPWSPSRMPDMALLQIEQQRLSAGMSVRADGPPILLVEDNTDTRVMIAEYLSMRGYRVTQAQNGYDALRCARTEAPALIIMDIQLPDMDGLTATRTLRSELAFAATPILVLSAHAMPGDRTQALDAGANAYLSKPVRLAELIALATTLIYPETEPSAV